MPILLQSEGSYFPQPPKAQFHVAPDAMGTGAASNPTDLFGTLAIQLLLPRALNCSNSIAKRIAGLGSGAALPIGTTIEKFVVSDSSGATDTCSFKITVNSVTGIAQQVSRDNSLLVASPAPTSDQI
jgi:hypothetical protein